MNYNLLELLRADGSIVINKRLVKQIGLVEAAVYSELVSMFIFWKNKNELVDGKWFYCTAERLKENTSLGVKPQRSAIARLTELGLIETKKMGLPAKKYFTITSKVEELLLDRGGQESKVSSSQMDKQGSPKGSSKDDHKGQTSLTQTGKQGLPKRSNMYNPNEQACITQTDEQDCPNGSIINTDHNTDYNEEEKENNAPFFEGQNLNEENSESTGKIHFDPFSEDQNLNEENSEAHSEPNFETPLTMDQVEKYLRDELHYSEITITDILKSLKKHNVKTLSAQQMFKQDLRIKDWITKNRQEIFEFGTFFVNGILKAEQSAQIRDEQTRDLAAREQNRSSPKSLKIYNWVS